jgi:hypothetical protein
MRITIIVTDKTVCKNGVCVTNLSWEGTPSTVRALQWYEDHGEIEFKNGLPNEIITELPVWANNAVNVWDATYVPPPPQVPPTPAEINKFNASKLLAETDWTTIPAVSDPAQSNPYLTNLQEFLEFRNIVRAVAINPPEALFEFSPIPKAQWLDN